MEPKKDLGRNSDVSCPPPHPPQPSPGRGLVWKLRLPAEAAGVCVGGAHSTLRSAGKRHKLNIEV